MSAAKIDFELNGEPVSISAGAGRRFSRVLREDFGLTGTKVGCNAGDCGACTILVDSKAVCACMLSAQQVAGHSVETVEGLANGRSICDGRLQLVFATRRGAVRYLYAGYAGGSRSIVARGAAAEHAAGRRCNWRCTLSLYRLPQDRQRHCGSECIAIGRLF